jgi:hypothetical protein
MTTTSEKVDLGGDTTAKDVSKEDKTKPSGFKSYLVSLPQPDWKLTPNMFNRSASFAMPTTSQEFFTLCLLLPPSQPALLCQSWTSYLANS